MKKKLILRLTLVFLSVNFVHAAEKIRIVIKDMTCIYCAQGLKSNFKNQKAVKNVKVEAKDKTILLTLNDDAILDDKKITRIVTNGGYHIEKIERTHDQ